MKNTRRIIVFVLTVLLVVAVSIGTNSLKVNAATTGLTLAQLRQKFPHGMYWNGGNADSYTSRPCTHHGNCQYNGSCGCNSFFGLSIQCMGYAEKLGYDATGYNPRNNANGWYTYKNASALDNVKPGDIVRYVNAYGEHSIYVIGVNGNTITYTDGNSDGHCIIRWDAVISKTTLKSNFVHMRAAPFQLSDDTYTYTSIPQDVYFFKNNASGKYLSVSSAADVQGQNVNVWTYNGYAEQQMKVIPVSDGYKIQPGCCASRMINVYTANTVSPGCNVTIWDDTGHASQHFKFERVTTGYIIRNVQAPYCVLALGSDGSNVEMQSYTGNNNQIWSIDVMNPYKVSYNGNGGSNVPATQSKGFDTSLPLSTQQPTRSGYDFLGWATSASATQAEYSAGGWYRKNASVTLYAVWKTHQHSWNSGVVTKQATCTAAGVKTYTCSSCGDSYTSSIPATGHSENGWKTGEVSTCLVAGFQYNYCSKCGWGGTRPLPLEAHLYQNGKCKNCGAKDPSANFVTITKQPTNASAYKYSNVTLTVSATGDGLTYQWYYKHTNQSAFAKSTKPATNTYVNKMVSTCNGEKVYCVITDKYGNSVKTNTVTLSIKNAATITKQPVSVKVGKGSIARVTVTATGDGLKYTWYVLNPSTTKWVKSSITKSTYSFAMDAAKSGRKVYCVVTDKYGHTVKSSTVTMSMAAAPKITKQPVSVKAAKGATAKVTVTATGEGLKYTWYVQNPGTTKWVKSSVTKSTYSFTMSADKSGRKVYCVVTDKYGQKVTSKTVTLSMAAAPKITKQPVSVKAAKGATAKVTVTATGEGLKYTWYVQNPGTTKWVKSSVTKSTYSFTMSADKSGRKVYCVVTDKYGQKVQTKTVTLSIPAALKITKQPASVKVANGKMATVTVGATGEGLTYEWYYKDRGMAAFRYTSTYKGNTYSVQMTNARSGRQLYCVVADKYGKSVTSYTVTISKK